MLPRAGHGVNLTPPKQGLAQSVRRLVSGLRRTVSIQLMRLARSV